MITALHTLTLSVCTLAVIVKVGLVDWLSVFIFHLVNRCMHFDDVFTAQLESNGDPWTNYSNVDPDSVRYFWEYFYFVLIMLTTIGFGDIYPNTTLGKLFLVFYVLLCLVSREIIEMSLFVSSVLSVNIRVVVCDWQYALLHCIAWYCVSTPIL